MALLVHNDEIKEQSIECLKHLHQSQDFRDDIAMHKYQWFYTPEGRRCLLLNFKPDREKESVKHEAGLAGFGANLRTEKAKLNLT